MGVKYCEAIDVKRTSPTLSQTYDRNSVDIDAAIEAGIDEASSICRTLLQNKYSITLINSSIPDTVRDFTKVKAALIVVSEYFPTDDSIEMLGIRAKKYGNIFLNGQLLDNDGVPLPQTIYTSTFHPPSLLGEA